MNKQEKDKAVTIGFTKMFFGMGTIPGTVYLWDYVLDLGLYDFTIVSLLFLIVILLETVWVSNESIKLIELAEEP
jgi:hypothetical protein